MELLAFFWKQNKKVRCWICVRNKMQNKLEMPLKTLSFMQVNKCLQKLFLFCGKVSYFSLWLLPAPVWPLVLCCGLWCLDSYFCFKILFLVAIKILKFSRGPCKVCLLAKLFLLCMGFSPDWGLARRRDGN